jgi:uncharacterized protein YecT (DUF1311 family)
MKIKKTLLTAPLLIAMALGTNATAASFDCRKASTGIEQVICEDPELNRLDEKMGRLYHEARGIPGMKQEQRDWVGFRNHNCGSSDGCLLAETKKRIRELKKALGKSGGSSSSGNKPHRGAVFSPERGIICDKKSSLCMDGEGISVAFTKMYLGDAAANKLMKRMDKYRSFDTSWVTFSNGLDCRAKERVCYTSKHSGVVDRHWTKILFAY